MRTVRDKSPTKKSGTMSGFTLAEVLISMAILVAVLQGVIMTYTASARRVEWNAHSLAAQSLAAQGAEQARSAVWNSQAWPQAVGPGQSDELGLTNYLRTDTLDIPVNGNPLIVTNYVSITTVSVSPPVRQIRSDCAWRFLNRGWYTNTVILLRAPDQ